MARSRGYLSTQHIMSLAVMVVLSASGMVSFQYIAFVIFSFIYMYFLSKVAFPSLSSSVAPPLYGKKNKLMGFYMLITAITGLFLPIAYIFEGTIAGDHKEGIKAAVPHAFLLATQVLMEGVAFWAGFSLPIGIAYVPVLYNSVRIFTIMGWLRSEFSKVDGGGSAIRLYIGRGLAVANMALWCFNLFGLLLPVFLPKVFKIYYSSPGLKN